VAAIGCIVAGLQTSWAAVVCFSFCAFVTVTITQEFVRGVAIRRRNTGSDSVSALMGMVLRGKRRYGGYIVHVGIVLMFLGFAGTAYQKESEFHLSPGQQETIGRYTLKFDRLAHEEDRQKEMVTGEITVVVDGKVIDHLRPAKWFFRNHESEPTTEVAIRRSPAEDLYITLGNYDLAEGNVAIKAVVNPVVDWIWFGFMLLALGTGVAMLPESVLERLTVRVGARSGSSSATGAAGLLLFLAAGLAGMGTLAYAPPVRAGGMGTTSADAPSPQGVDENWLVRNIICQCGSCRHNLIECASEGCGHATQDRIAIHNLLGEGKTRDDVVQFFIRKYGSQIALASPLDEGFNRLIWALPYTLGVLGAVGLGFGAYRLSRRPKPAAAGGPSAPVASADLDLQDKLDDELRNLD
jgi:cytochrome c-type biogenesis protein CcmF